jgi:secondary thiamine-phosphate synthase enzyme
MITAREILTEKNGVHDITAEVKEIIAQSGVKNGILVVETPHPTAGILALSFSDPLVQKDLVCEIKRLVPSRITFHHEDSPDDAAGQIKRALFGSSVTAILQDGAAVSEETLGYFLCEYDGPRKRRFFVVVIEDK